MELKTDILIVGCGVSGSVAGLNLSKDGFSVAMVEKLPKLGIHTQNKIDITENEGIEEIVNNLQLPIKDKTNKSRWFSDNHSFYFESKIYDLYIKRGFSDDSFENIVVNSAIDKGATLYLDSMPIKLIRQNNKITSVKIKGKSNIIIKPKVIIAADGHNSSMLQLSGKAKDEKKITSISGYGLTGQGFDIPNSETYIFFDKVNAPGGYFFIARARDGEGVACVVIDESIQKLNIQNYFKTMTNENKIIKKILSNSHNTSYFSGKSHIGLIKNKVQNNLIFVGDASRTLDPLFGYGVKNSIISGFRASEVIKEFFEKNFLTSFLENYENKMHPVYAKIKKDIFLRKVFNKLNNNDFDTIISLLSSLKERNLKIDDFFDENYYIILKEFLKKPYPTSKIILKALTALIH